MFDFIRKVDASVGLKIVERVRRYIKFILIWESCAGFSRGFWTLCYLKIWCFYYFPIIPHWSEAQTLFACLCAFAPSPSMHIPPVNALKMSQWESSDIWKPTAADFTEPRTLLSSRMEWKKKTKRKPGGGGGGRWEDRCDSHSSKFLKGSKGGKVGKM